MLYNSRLIGIGITRDSIHKRRSTGGKLKRWRKKRKYDLGRQPAHTKLGEKRIHEVRVRGGNKKFRALRLESGNFSWGTESMFWTVFKANLSSGITKKSRILDVVYNASNNEMVRTKTLVKGAIVQIDATPFRQWYEQHYGVVLGKKTAATAQTTTAAPATRSKAAEAKFAARAETRALEHALEEQFNTGRLLVAISSRPGQSGRADGYILEGKELEFYHRKITQKKKH